MVTTYMGIIRLGHILAFFPFAKNSFGRSNSKRWHNEGLLDCLRCGKSLLALNLHLAPQHRRGVTTCSWSEGRPVARSDTLRCLTKLSPKPVKSREKSPALFFALLLMRKPRGVRLKLPLLQHLTLWQPPFTSLQYLPVLSQLNPRL